MTQSRVLVFGESENDTKAIREFIQVLCPHVRVEIRRKPIVLIKNARPENVRPQADQIGQAVAAEEINGHVSCVFAHEDGDCVEPGHEAIADTIENALLAALRRAGVTECSVHAVVPAWEIENWLLLWPEVVGDHAPSWRAPTEFLNRSVGLLPDGKETLRAAVRPRGAARSRRRAREYKESDAPAIARAVCARGLAETPNAAASASYARFRASVLACCAASPAGPQPPSP